MSLDVIREVVSNSRLSASALEIIYKLHIYSSNISYTKQLIENVFRNGTVISHIISNAITDNIIYLTNVSYLSANVFIVVPTSFPSSSMPTKSSSNIVNTPLFIGCVTAGGVVFIALVIGFIVYRYSNKIQPGNAVTTNVNANDNARSPRRDNRIHDEINNSANINEMYSPAKLAAIVPV